MRLLERSKIRHYLINLLKDEVDVGGRVFANRTESPFVQEELPAICVTFTNEPAKVIVGSSYLPKEYEKALGVTISGVVEEGNVPGVELDTGDAGEDYLDWLMGQAEEAINADKRLSKRLEGYNPATNREGLTFGAVLVNTVTYDVDTKSEKRLIAQDKTFIFPYNTKAYSNIRLNDFLTYYAAIVRVGSTEETVDRVLIAAEGDINNGDN